MKNLGTLLQGAKEVAGSVYDSIKYVGRHAKELGVYSVMGLALACGGGGSGGDDGIAPVDKFPEYVTVLEGGNATLDNLSDGFLGMTITGGGKVWNVSKVEQYMGPGTTANNVWSYRAPLDENTTNDDLGRVGIRATINNSQNTINAIFNVVEQDVGAYKGLSELNEARSSGIMLTYEPGINATTQDLERHMELFGNAGELNGSNPQLVVVTSDLRVPEIAANYGIQTLLKIDQPENDARVNGAINVANNTQSVIAIAVNGDYSLVGQVINDVRKRTGGVANGAYGDHNLIKGIFEGKTSDEKEDLRATYEFAWAISTPVTEGQVDPTTAGNNNGLMDKGVLDILPSTIPFVSESRMISAGSFSFNDQDRYNFLQAQKQTSGITPVTELTDVTTWLQYPYGWTYTLSFEDFFAR